MKNNKQIIKSLKKLLTLNNTKLMNECKHINPLLLEITTKDLTYNDLIFLIEGVSELINSVKLLASLDKHNEDLYLSRAELTIKNLYCLIGVYTYYLKDFQISISEKRSLALMNTIRLNMYYLEDDQMLYLLNNIMKQFHKM